MKNLLFLPFLLTLLLLSISISAIGQSSSEFERTFDFNMESSESDFVIEIDPNTTELGFFLQSTIKTGDLKVSLISPSGKKEGGFRLQSTKSKSKTKMKGDTNSNSNSSSNSSSNSKNKSVNKSKNKTVKNSVFVTSTGSSSGSKVEVNTDSESGDTFVYSMSSNSNSTSRGNMNKSISNPEAGTWKVIVDTKDVTGLLMIKVGQMSNN